MRPVDRGPQPVGVIVRDYEDWRPYLILRLGSYCSYCELPLTSPVPVEHKIPKDQQPEGPQGRL